MAIQLAPQAAVYYKELGKICEQNDDLVCANQAYQNYLDRQTSQYDSDFWDQTEFRNQVLNTWKQLHPVKQKTITRIAGSVDSQ